PMPTTEPETELQPVEAEVPAENESMTPQEAPATEAGPSSISGQRSHIVQRGQSLWSIASELLGSGERMREILELNPSLMNDPNQIHPGQELTLPAGEP